MKQEENSNYSIADLKEKSKRDTNDFLSEAGSAKDEFQRLMNESKPFHQALIDTLPSKNSPDFGDKLKEIFEVARAATAYVREDIFSMLAEVTKFKLAFIKKEFNKESVIARSDAAEGIRLGSLLINYYTSDKGISNQPQAPLSSIVEIVVERLFEGNYEFYVDSSMHQIYMKDEDERVIPFDPRNPEFAEWAFKVLELSSVHREPVKDIVQGMSAALISDPRVLKHSSLGFNGRVEKADGSVLAVYHQGPETHDLIVVAPSTDGKTPNVTTVANFDESIGIGLLAPPMQKIKISYVPDVDMDEAMWLMKELFCDSQSLKDEDKLRSFCHKFQCLLPGPCRRKMRKANRGAPGAGKTTDGDLLSLLFYGSSAAGAYGDEKELWYAANFNPLQTIDNWEGVAKKEQAEFARLHATGGSKTFRKLYSDNQMITYSPNSHIIDAAVEGFSQGEDAEREQVYLYDERFMNPDFSISAVEKKIIKNRDLMWSAFFNALSIHVLPEIDSLLSKYERHLKTRPHSKRRFNDFIARQAIIVDLVRPYWGIQEPTTSILDCWMSVWSREDESTAGELDPIIQRLEIIFTDDRFNSIGSTRTGIGSIRASLMEGITSTKLHALLCQVEKEFGLPRAYHSPSVLAQRLRISLKIWGDSYGSCEVAKRNKIMVYRFTFER